MDWKLSFRARLLALLAVILVASPAAARPTSAATAGKVLLDGSVATISAATEYHCHDLKLRLECFTSAQARNRTVRATIATTTVSAASSGYVIAWADASYLGASVVLSQDYANLGSIGWNDRISSYKVYTSLTGAFYQHSSYWGTTKYFCCFSNVAYVGNAYNDLFSSFDLP